MSASWKFSRASGQRRPSRPGEKPATNVWVVGQWGANRELPHVQQRLRDQRGHDHRRHLLRGLASLARGIGVRSRRGNRGTSTRTTRKGLAGDHALQKYGPRLRSQSRPPTKPHGRRCRREVEALERSIGTSSPRCGSRHIHRHGDLIILPITRRFCRRRKPHPGPLPLRHAGTGVQPMMRKTYDEITAGAIRFVVDRWTMMDQFSFATRAGNR